MREDSWEWYYRSGEPSPLERVIIVCKAKGCNLVMNYHELHWREATESEIRYINVYKVFFVGVCPDCWEAEQTQEEENEEDQ